MSRQLGFDVSARGALQAHHQGAAWELVLGDSIALLSKLPPESVDLIFADPPYNLSNGGSTCRGGERVSVDKGEWDVSRGVAGDHDFNRRWLGACRRVLKPTGTIWVSGTHHVIFSVGFAMQAMGFHVLNCVTWFKPNASPNLGCRQLTHSTELVVWAAPREYQPLRHTFHYEKMREENDGKQLRDLWTFPPPGPAEKIHNAAVNWPKRAPAISSTLDLFAPFVNDTSEDAESIGHPTQKPLALLDRIIRCSTNTGDLVLDPFNGSGTTGVKAVELGRHYIGIDLSDLYLDLTALRIRAVGGAP